MKIKEQNRIAEANGDKPTPTVADLKRSNAEQATNAVNAILEKYDCAIAPRLLVTPQGNQFIIDIVSK